MATKHLHLSQTKSPVFREFQDVLDNNFCYRNQTKQSGNYGNTHGKEVFKYGAKYPIIFLILGGAIDKLLENLVFS